VNIPRIQVNMSDITKYDPFAPTPEEEPSEISLDKCTRCTRHDAILLHIRWPCLGFQRYDESVFIIEVKDLEDEGYSQSELAGHVMKYYRESDPSESEEYIKKLLDTFNDCECPYGSVPITRIWGKYNIVMMGVISKYKGYEEHASKKQTVVSTE